MSELTDQIAAEAAFQTLCQAFKRNKWWHQVYENQWKLVGRCRSGQQQIDVNFTVKPDAKLVYLTSLMPLQVEEDRELEMAIAVSKINSKLSHGSFDYNILTGTVVFHMACSFVESQLGEGAFEYMMVHAGQTISKYGKLLQQFTMGVCSLGFLRKLLSSDTPEDGLTATDSMKTRAQEVFQALCNTIQPQNPDSYRDDDNLFLGFYKETAGMSVRYYFQVNAIRETITVRAGFPYEMDESRKMEGAVAACAASYGHLMGNFHYDIDEGNFEYHVATSFRESQLGAALYWNLFSWVEAMMTRYCIQFMTIDQGTKALADMVNKEFAE